jgi:hypothetical protein
MRGLFLASLAASTLFAAAAHAQIDPGLPPSPTPPPAPPALPSANYAFLYPDFTPQQTQIDVTGAFKTLDQFIQGLKDASGRVSPQFDLAIRGIPATLGTDGPTFLILTIPSLGVNQTFSAQTADETFAQLKAFLTQSTIARQIQRESARVSPVDPVAGNPASLMARAVAYDFFNAFYPFASNNVEGSAMIAQVGGIPQGAAQGPFRGLPGLGLRYDRFSDQGQATQGVTLPLSYTFRSDLDPRRQVTVSLPITAVDIDGARAYMGTFSTALRLPVTRDWALSGSLGYSQVRATELGTAGQIGSVALTSNYVFRTNVGDLALGNMVGYYKTIAGKIGDIETGSGIANTVLRNGLLWSERAGWLGSGMTIEYTLVNTHYLGSELYLKNYTELGVNVGSNKRADSVRSYLQGGLTYLFSSKTKGFMGNFNYWF